MKKIIIGLCIVFVPLWPQSSETYSDYPISPLSIKSVIINDHFWLPKITLIQDTTIRYAFNKCETEGRMDNFLIAGGKEPGPVRGKMPFDDTDPYKIIEGASYSLISKPNPTLDAYLDSVIAIIKIGQEPDGYITTWFTIDRQHPPATWVKPSTHRWEHLESSHELYNSGHLFEAAAAHYWATGKRTLLNIALKNADLLVNNFGPGKLTTPPGHEIVETGLIKLYHITHDEKYLKLAKYFLDIRGDSTTHALRGEYSQDQEPVVEQTEAVGHAVRALYLYAGMTDIAAIYNDSAYLHAVKSIWNNVVDAKMYITGGLGARHDGEAFGNNYELPNLTAYNETCASIGSVYWNQRLFLLTGDAKYYDIIERTLYNGLLSGISLDGKKFFYPNPTESNGKYEFNMGSATRQPWFDCSCCPTNLIRFIPSLPGLIYAVDNDTLYANLFISNTAHLTMNGQDVEIRQRTEYPWDGRIVMTVTPAQSQKFTLRIRIPEWARNKVAPGNLYSFMDTSTAHSIITVNESEVHPAMTNGYAEISREWQRGDSIVLTLPMAVRKVIADERAASDSGKVSFEYGPLVYCAEGIDNGGLTDIAVPGSVRLNRAPKTIQTEHVIALHGSVHGKELTLIPYYSWSNRGVGTMNVWFPLDKRSK